MKFKNMSVATKNALVLIMTVVPFLIGMVFSIVKSNDLDYFGTAINISGSQRMRTMLISNYSQQVYDGNREEAILILEKEIPIYKQYMSALSLGDDSLELIENKYDDILFEIQSFSVLYEEYINAAEELLQNPNDEEALHFITENAMSLKNHVHLVVELYETQYLKELQTLKYIDYSIIVFSVTLTLAGLFLNLKIGIFEKYSTFDYLTGLKSRRMIEVDAKQMDKNDISVIFIDLDKFKEVNDIYGHDIGDEVLIEAARRLEDAFSPASVYRFAGDEFVVLLDSKSKEEVRKRVQNLKDSLSSAFVDSNGNEHYVGFSAGCVVGDAVQFDVSKSLELADDLMYDSKNYKSRIYIVDTLSEIERRRDMKKRIVNSLDLEEFYPVFQSIVSRESEHMGYELLARWNLDGKCYSPKAFLPLLRRAGMMEEFDLHMLELCNRTLLANPNLKKEISVNISSEFINSSRFESNKKILDKYNLDKKLLLLELSEDTMLDDRAVNNLKKLHQDGYHLVIDDFTAGNTSLEVMKLDFIKRVKLDMSVVSGLEVNYKWVEEIIQFLHSMKKNVLAEGVETKEQFEELSKLGVDCFQGYYFDKPHKDI